MTWFKSAAPASPWLVCLGIFLAGATLLSGSLLVVAAVRAANYSGYGETNVFNLLTWGFPMTFLSAGALALVVLTQLVARRTFSNSE